MLTNNRVLLGLAALVMILLLGCRPMPAAPAPTEAPPVVQAFTTAHPDTGQCLVQVVVEKPEASINLDIQVYSEPGILFNATNNTESETQSVSMLTTDRRELSFSCRLNPAAVRLSGAYVVRAVARHQGSGRSYKQAINHLYIMAPDMQTAQLLTGREEFDRHYTEGYISGANGIAYLADLDANRGHGVMYVRVPGAATLAGPVLQVHTAGGFQFSRLSDMVNTHMASTRTVVAQLPTIAEHGLRIVPIPFTVEPGVGPGNYSLEVTADYHNHRLTEVAPYYIQVAVDQTTGQASAVSLQISTAEPSLVAPAPPAVDPAPEDGPVTPELEEPRFHQATTDQ